MQPKRFPVQAQLGWWCRWGTGSAGGTISCGLVKQKSRILKFNGFIQPLTKTCWGRAPSKHVQTDTRKTSRRKPNNQASKRPRPNKTKLSRLRRGLKRASVRSWNTLCSPGKNKMYSIYIHACIVYIYTHMYIHWKYLGNPSMSSIIAFQIATGKLTNIVWPELHSKQASKPGTSLLLFSHWLRSNGLTFHVGGCCQTPRCKANPGTRGTENLTDGFVWGCLNFWEKIPKNKG